MSKSAVLFRMATDKHLCPYGLKSRDLLKRKGYDVDDRLLTSREAIENFKEAHSVDTTPQTFIDSKRVGGYDDLRNYFGSSDNKNTTSYTPIVAIFGMTLLMALAILWRQNTNTEVINLITIFISFSMCVLAIQKLRDLEAFSLQFITYDLIAMHYVPYAFAYAYLEAFAGLAMLAQLPAWLAAPPAIFIGAVGAASVYKAVYLDKRELKCACVGGNSNVPLGVVSMTENLMMVAMGLWMLL